MSDAPPDSLPDSLIVDRRFCGPSGMGNGGYACGVTASQLAGAAQVRLHRPVPLDRPLAIERHPDGVHIRDGAALVAEARPADPDLDLDLEIPAPPSYAEAERAARAYAGFADHPAATCVVCGTERSPGDGLRIFSGPVAGRGLVAAPWIPDASVAGADDRVRAEIVWAAIDCPGAWACNFGTQRVLLLGQLTATVRRRPAVGERCVVMGWQIARDGRKNIAGSALVSADGALCAYGKAIWIEVATL